MWDFETIYNLAGPSASRGRHRVRRSRSRSSSSRRARGAGRRSSPELGLLADDFPEPFLKIYRPAQAARRRRSPPASRYRSSRSSGRWAYRPTSRGALALPSAQGRRQHRLPAPRRPARRYGCRSGARVRSSPAATRTLRRATARSASARSSAACRRHSAFTFASALSRARLPRPRSRSRSPGPYYGTMGIDADLMRAPARRCAT